MNYSIKKQLNYSFAEAIEKTKAALSEEGFGILTEIDVKATLKNRLDVVCGMELDIENVRHSFEHGGIEYYFCSETCGSHFIDDPEKYVGGNLKLT